MAGHRHLPARQFHLGTKRDLTSSPSFTPNLNNHSHSYTVKYSIQYCPRIVNTLNSAACIFNIIQALTFSKMHKIQRQLKLLSIQTVLVEKKALRTLLIRYEMGLPWQSINNDAGHAAAVSRACTFHARYAWNRENNSQVTISCIIFSSLLKFAFHKAHSAKCVKNLLFEKAKCFHWCIHQENTKQSFVQLQAGERFKKPQDMEVPSATVSMCFA